MSSGAPAAALQLGEEVVEQGSADLRAGAGGERQLARELGAREPLGRRQTLRVNGGGGDRHATSFTHRSPTRVALLWTVGDEVVTAAAGSPPAHRTAPRPQPTPAGTARRSMRVRGETRGGA